MDAHRTPGPDQTTPATPDTPASHHRRTVLRGAAALGLLGLGGALTGCGDDDAGTTTTQQGSDTPAGTTPADTSTDTAGTGTAAGDAATRVGAGTALGRAADVPVGGGKIYKDAAVVVTQPTKGKYKAFTATCTHTGCLVGEVADGTINCFCHGSKYSIKDGSVVAPPAPKPLAPKEITVAGGKIALA